MIISLYSEVRDILHEYYVKTGITNIEFESHEFIIGETKAVEKGVYKFYCKDGSLYEEGKWVCCILHIQI